MFRKKLCSGKFGITFLILIQFDNIFSGNRAEKTVDVENRFN